MFRERASRVRDGFQINCQNCSKLLTLNRDSEDPFIRRALRTAKDIRAALEAVGGLGPARDGLAVLAAFDVVFLVAGWLLFTYVVRD